MNVSENTQILYRADGQSTYPTAEESIENPGYMITYHPKPDEYEPSEWFHMVKCLLTSKGYVVQSVLAAVEWEPDDNPYPLKRHVKTWGVEATWSAR